MSNQTAPTAKLSNPSATLTLPGSPWNKLTDRTTNIDNVNDIKSYIEQEQSKITEELDYLLNFEPKRKPGRPKNDAPAVNDKKIPTFINTNLQTFTNVNELHPGVLLDYITRINSLNNKLFKGFTILSEKYNDLNEKYNLLTERVDNKPILTTPTSESVEPTATIASSQRETVFSNEGVTSLQLKIDSLEQKSYDNVLLLNGPITQELLNESDNNWKGNIIEKIKDQIPNVPTETIQNITVFGKSKRQLKITCSDVKSKSKILFEAKKKKSQQIFFSEYLTDYRFKLYIKLRNLKKTHPRRLTAVYTRHGNIFYKLDSKAEHHLLRHQKDLDELKHHLNL